jgi:hypothetical protein
MKVWTSERTRKVSCSATALAPGFRELPTLDRRVIFDFSFLWSLFEARLTGKFARADYIRERVDEWVVGGVISEAELYDGELAYVCARYFVAVH